MGNYATITSISLRMPDIMDGNTTSSDSKFKDTFSEYIDKAESEFNAAVAPKYNLPFSTVPPLARDISFELAAYYTLRAFSSRDWPNRNEYLEDFEEAFEKLEKLSEGQMRLTLTDGSLLSVKSSVALSNRTGQGAIFDVDSPTAWKADENRLDDLEGSRD